MKQEWQKITLQHEFADLTFHCKGDFNIPHMQMNMTEKQQLTLISNFKLKDIIKFKIKLFLQRVINWITNVSDYRVKPFDIKQELKQAKRYFKD